MIVYLGTIAALLLFGGLAQSADTKRDDELSYGRVKHSIPTGLMFAFAALVLICVAGFRYYVGTDFGYYYKWDGSFETVKHCILTLDEPGYYIIAYLTRLVADSGAAVIFVTSLVTVGLAMLVIYRNTDRLLVALLLFMFLECWQEGFNGVRQCLSAAVLFTGFSFLRDKKYVKYLIVVFIAFLFHKSVAVMTLVPLLVHRKISGMNLLILIVAAAVVLFSYDRVLNFTGWLLDNEVSSDSEYSYVTSAVNIFRILVAVAPAVFFIVINWKKDKDEATTFYLNLLLLNALVMTAAAGSTYLARMGIYSAPFCIIATAELTKTIPKKYRGVIVVVMLVLYCAFCLYDVSISPALHNWQWAWNAA